MTQATIAAEGMGGRVSVQAGDLWIDDFGSGYDVALLFNIISTPIWIHCYAPTARS